MGTIGRWSSKSVLSPSHASTVLALCVDRLRTAVPVSWGTPWAQRQPHHEALAKAHSRQDTPEGLPRAGA